jgi:hypothetical protein
MVTMSVALLASVTLRQDVTSGDHVSSSSRNVSAKSNFIDTSQKHGDIADMNFAAVRARDAWCTRTVASRAGAVAGLQK